MKKGLLSIFAMALLMLVSTIGYAQSTYTKVTSASGLEVGANYLIVAHNDELGVLAMGYQKANNRNAVVVSEAGDAITVVPGTDPSSTTDVFEFTLGGSNNGWTFFDEVKGGYLYAASSSGNQLKTQTTLDANGQWSINFNNDGTAEVVALGDNTRNNMRFNPNTTNGDPLFSCYAETSNIDTRVSFYKAGSATIDPEPTNYPTNFTATVMGVDITLTWTDATGGQLPTNYLVMGDEGTVAPPVDGQPIGNGPLVANVHYGAQTVTFSGLEGNTTYHFAIFPYTNAGNNIDYKTDGNYPTAQATTESIETLLNEDFDGDLGMFTSYSVLGEQEWHAASYGGVTYANMNGYASGAAHANEDWLISPEIPFNRSFDAIVLEFSTAMKFDGNPLLVKVSSDFVGGAPSDGNWVDITDAFDYSTGNYEWVESGRVNIASELTNQLGFFHIAFVYTSTDDAASSWEIDFVKVTGENGVSVNETVMPTVSVYPNPAREVVSFNLKSDAQVSLFDMTGRMVSTMQMAAGEANCQVAGLENGVYMLQVRYADGETAVARFVKY